MDAAAVKKQLTIKSGVVKRLTKEEKTYVKEAEDQKKRIEKYIEEGKDEWHVNKQKEVLQDCLQMVPDCQKRLATAVADLQSIVDSLADDEALNTSAEAQGAREVLEEAAKASAVSSASS